MTADPIGYVHSPYREQAGTPIQANFGEPIAAQIHVLPPFREGLRDLAGFSHLWVLTWLDRAKPYELLTVPYRDTVQRGLFATRAPSRPNPVGLSCTRLTGIEHENGILHVLGLDILNGTPVLDIKPYLPQTDAFPQAASGWFAHSKDINEADDRFHHNALPSNSPEQSDEWRALREQWHPGCIVCGNGNTRGLQLSFTACADGSVEGIFNGEKSLEGYSDVIHGGVVSSLLDGAMTNCLFAHGIAAVTAELIVRFLHPLSVRKSAVVRAWIARSTSHLYFMAAEILQDNAPAATACAKFRRPQQAILHSMEML